MKNTKKPHKSVSRKHEYIALLLCGLTVVMTAVSQTALTGQVAGEGQAVSAESSSQSATLPWYASVFDSVRGAYDSTVQVVGSYFEDDAHEAAPDEDAAPKKSWIQTYITGPLAGASNTVIGLTNSAIDAVQGFAADVDTSENPSWTSTALNAVKNVTGKVANLADAVVPDSVQVADFPGEPAGADEAVVGHETVHVPQQPNPTAPIQPAVPAQPAAPATPPSTNVATPAVPAVPAAPSVAVGCSNPMNPGCGGGDGDGDGGGSPCANPMDPGCSGGDGDGDGDGDVVVCSVNPMHPSCSGGDGDGDGDGDIILVCTTNPMHPSCTGGDGDGDTTHGGAPDCAANPMDPACTNTQSPLALYEFNRYESRYISFLSDIKHSVFRIVLGGVNSLGTSMLANLLR